MNWTPQWWEKHFDRLHQQLTSIQILLLCVILINVWQAVKH